MTASRPKFSLQNNKVRFNFGNEIFHLLPTTVRQALETSQHPSGEVIQQPAAEVAGCASERSFSTEEV